MHTANRNVQDPANATPPWSKDEEEISVLDLLSILARRRRFIAATTLIFGALALIVSLFLTRQYTAMTIIMPPQSSSPGSALLAQLGPLASLGGSLAMKNSNDMYVTMFESRPVEDAMVQRFDLMAEYRTKNRTDARKIFDSKCNIQGNEKDGLIRIFVTDKDPKRAAQLADGYVEEFRKFSSTLAVTEASQRRLFFEQQLEKTKDNLANAEEALKKTQTSGVLEVNSQSMVLIQSAASLRAQIAAKEVEIQAMRSFSAEQNPDLLLAEQELAAWQVQLRHLTGNQAGHGDDMLISKGQIPSAGLDYVRKMREVKYNEAIFELLAKQLEMAKLDEAKQGSLIQVLDPAQPPDVPSFPRRKLIVAIATAVGFVCALLWVFMKEALVEFKIRTSMKQHPAA